MPMDGRSRKRTVHELKPENVNIHLILIQSPTLAENNWAKAKEYTQEP